MNDSQPILSARSLKKHFAVDGVTLLSRKERKFVRAVDGVNLDLYPQETLSLVGESGSGKTTTARMILRLIVPTSGQVLFEGEDVAKMRGAELKRYRASVQAVFQDPWSSLNPRKRAGSIVAEPIVINQPLPKPQLEARVRELFSAVGLDPAVMGHYPHEFSGGMRQRIAVARSLALNPSVIVLDEPVSALDVSIRAQIMNLLRDLQEQFQISYLLIAHDLATVRYLSDRVAVMYLGKLVEVAHSEELFENPLHPYTQALIAGSRSTVMMGEEEADILAGDIPSPVNPPPGCAFHARCPVSVAARTDDPDFYERTVTEQPRLIEVRPGHLVACHQYGAMTR
jgi:oligopeptide/dipeptide ABC transporter ATP-binding protein